MKRYKYILAALTVTLAGCENSDRDFPDFDYRTVYFASQYPVRTIILGEDPESDNTIDNEHKCQIQATTGGGYSNPNNIVVRYTVDNGMVDGLYFKDTDRKIHAMPSTYYKLSSDQIEIQSGKERGGVTVELTDDFFNDQYAIDGNYVIPLRITHTEGADSVLRGNPAVSSPNRFITEDWITVPKDYTLYCVKFINPWHAHYLRRGLDQKTGKAGHETLTGTQVRHETYVEKDEKISLTTSAYRSVKMSLNAKDESSNNIPYTAIITFADDGSCSVTSAAPDSYQISGTGKFVKRGDKNSWGNQDRDVLYLDYTVDLPQLTCHTLDTLVMHYRGVTKESFIPEYKQ